MATALPDDMATVAGDVFAGDTLEGVEALTGGRSGAKAFSVTVAGKRYVVRRTSMGGGDEAARCLRIASDLGVAPRLVHSDVRSGVTILERVEGVPVRASPIRSRVTTI
jgi:hypothetical protein